MNSIINKLIRFLLKHCAIDSLTLHQCMKKREWQNCQLIVNEMKKEVSAS